MPLGSPSRTRGGRTPPCARAEWPARAALPVWITLATSAWLSCSAPDGSGLFEPYSPGAAGAGGAGSGGGGGSGASAGGSSAGLGGEGQGGALPLAGSAGAGGSSVAGETIDAGELPADAGSVDAGDEPDAGPPVSCEPSDEVCDGLDNDCDDVIDSGAACPDGCAGFTLADHAYMVCDEAVDRGIALARCGGEGMKLAWIETPGENAALVAAIDAVGLTAAGELLVQIGASDSDDEDEWFWIGNAAALDGFQFWQGNAAEDGGEPVGGAYVNWGDGEPNNSDNEDCGALSVSGSGARAAGQWDDRACAEELPFLCEVP